MSKGTQKSDEGARPSLKVVKEELGPPPKGGAQKSDEQQQARPSVKAVKEELGRDLDSLVKKAADSKGRESTNAAESPSEVAEKTEAPPAILLIIIY